MLSTARKARLDRRLSREQFCQRRRGALAGVFFYEFFDERGARLFLPLPACGERAGLRGALGERGVGEPPSPGCYASDLSPHAGRGESGRLDRGASFAASSSGNKSRKETPTRGVARISFLV